MESGTLGLLLVAGRCDFAATGAKADIQRSLLMHSWHLSCQQYLPWCITLLCTDSVPADINTSSPCAPYMPRVQIRCQRVIYHLMEDVGALLVGASPKQEVEVVAGAAEVLALFPLKGAR